uniref:hypothetical protein n=1 Tax=Klebsiella quasipneumoniae TaxID=1463165 RepID=UPI001F1C0647
SVHHIWCPLSSQEYQDLPDGAETTLTCGQALTFNDILHVETIDEIKNTLCPYCKMLISKEEITRQIQSNVARRIEAMLGGLK